MESGFRQWLRLLEGDGVRPTRNSEGKLIAPTADAQAAFWQWFGKSKVVDEHGQPLVVHRGDKLGKTEFTGRENTSKIIQGNIFFSSDRAIAKGYTPHRTNSYLAPSDMDQSHGLYSVYLKIEKPVVVDAKGEDWSRIPLSGRMKKAIGSDVIQIDDLALYVQQNTQSDGLIVKNVWDQFGDGHQFVVFSSRQIKLLPPSTAPMKVAKPSASSRDSAVGSYRWDDAAQDYVKE